MKLRVSPIPVGVTKVMLLEMFEDYGDVDSVQVLRGAKEAIALVEMPKNGEAGAAIDELDESELNGIMIRVESWHDHINRTEKASVRPIEDDDDDDDDEIDDGVIDDEEIDESDDD